MVDLISIGKSFLFVFYLIEMCSVLGAAIRAGTSLIQGFCASAGAAYEYKRNEIHIFFLHKKMSDASEKNQVGELLERASRSS